ncbi:MAG: hypothetical protein NXH70_02450 [Hyphomonas sp.]|nr:hypothetical protein [Hyphomonas sp.]
MAGLRDRIAQKRQAIADKSAGYERAFKWPVGKSYFRLLPGKVEADEFFEEIGVHWIKQNGKVVASVGDREICFGEPCPIREGIEAVMSHAREIGDDDMLKAAKDMMAKPRFFANGVIIKSPAEFEKDKPELLEFSEKTWDQILSQMEDMIEDLDEGADLMKEGPFAMDGGTIFVLEKTGTGLDTRYNVFTSAKKAPAKPDALEAAVDLGAYKRSQFDEKGRKALAALGAMIGEDLSDSIADALTSPVETKALAAPEADDDLSEDVIEGEVVEEPAAEADELSDDDILADLDEL